MCENRPKVRTGSQEVEKTLDELFKYLINVLGLVYFMIKVY